MPLAFLLSSCGPALHAPVMSLGKEYDGIMVAQHIPGKYAERCLSNDSSECTTPVYRVGNKHYVAGKAVTLRERKLWYWYAAEMRFRNKYARTSDNESIAYYPVQLKKNGEVSTYCKFTQEHTPVLTELPENARKPIGNYPFRSYYDNHCEYSGHSHCLRVDEDGHLTPHALYAYPAGALIFVGIDLPISIVTFTGCFIYGCIDEAILDYFD